MLTLKKSSAIALTTLLAATISGTLLAPAAAANTAATTTRPCSTAPFADVSRNHPLDRAIMWVNCENISRGYSDGTFRPNRTITRGEVARMLYRHSGDRHLAGKKRDFTDVPVQSSAFTAISWMKAEGISTGYSKNRFGVNQPITRGELASFLLRYSNSNKSYQQLRRSPFRDMSTTSPQYRAASWAYSNRLLLRDQHGNFNPKRYVSRGTTAMVLYAYEGKTTGRLPIYNR